MSNRVGFAQGEWYHCFTRGVDKRVAFESPSDYERFTELLFLVNSTEPMHRSNLKVSRERLFTLERPATLVSVGAYALMPNHFHLVLYEKEQGGISRFMQKLGVAYAMYFNIKNDRVGNLFVKPFRSRHLAQDEYFQHCMNYVHLNPVGLFEPGWKEGIVRARSMLEPRLFEYPYSSFPDFYLEQQRPESAILGSEIHSLFQKHAPADVLKGASEYYAENIKMLS